MYSQPAFCAGQGSLISEARVIRPQAADFQPLYVAIKGLP
jgi:hypothetical protein